MVRIIVSVILLVLLAVFVSLNLGYTTSISLLGARILDNVSIVAVSALSFAFGVVYSLFLYLGSYFRRKAKMAMVIKGQNMKEREKILERNEVDKAQAEKTVIVDATSPTV